jgi:hypothetical protein
MAELNGHKKKPQAKLESKSHNRLYERHTVATKSKSKPVQVEPQPVVKHIVRKK